jgi:hypothetical protein
VIVALLGVAWAEDACSAVATQSDVDEHLDKAFAAVDAADLHGLRENLNDVGPKLPCLEAAADQRSLARYGQLMAVASFFGQDEEAELRWGQFAKLIDPDVPWPSSIAADSPLRQAIDEEPIPPRSGPAGKSLLPPKGGAIAVNGNWTVEAAAYAEVPTLVQVFDGNANPTSCYWQDGAAFPSWILGDPNPSWSPPKWTRDPAGARTGGVKTAGTEKYRPQHDKIHLDAGPVLLTAALAAGSGALYALAASSHAGLDDAVTAEELQRVRTNTNAMFTAATLAAAGAVGYASVQILTDGAGVGLSLRF